MSAETDACNAAIATTDAFTAAFNARDLAGMDATLHFPHVILSGETLVVWEKPGQLRSDFFEELSAKTGWHHSAYQERAPVLVTPRKVHLLVRYSRNASDGNIITEHKNVWVVTYDGGRWGIRLRSY